MRDVKRINRILELIKKLWEKQPDQRFGQLLINLGVIIDDFDDWSREDDVLEKELIGALNDKTN